MLKQNAPIAIATITDSTGTTGSASFVIENSDANVFVGKLTSTGLNGTSPTLDVYIQTTDDGGTTWYDMVHFTQLTGAIANQNAYFAKFGDLKGSSAYVGQPESKHISAASVSSLPLLGRLVNVQYVYGGTVSTAAFTLQIYQADQDYR
ncbi:MAG: hypothetical protein KGJ90_04720 [Patescibacteria group bacterium]|nr:hypothetical protein [Patescibacteria group bacterium]